ncbi:MAG TPA: A/G-specific adenine glycosylase [Anaerolineales bacterium]|nr:A/G-specific adenine glycosylase [Anaerolineales bacterium]
MLRLSTRLLNWYNKNKRTLPWRGAVDPYAVWVSEIMLQQTRVETVIPYYEKWLKRFPTIRALAKASEQDVLNAWEGLGYYSRARNFHRAAKIVVEKHNGKLPSDLDELRKLPGIGRYTVGALASILFGLDEPALDGNLKRVYARLFDVTQPVDSTEGEALLWKLARENLPKGKAADFNQALMDLGALVCLPKNPRCLICPVTMVCKARQRGTQGLRPVKKTKKAIPHRVHAAAVIIRRGRVLLALRPSNGLLGGMWEFPNARVDGDPARELTKAIRSAYNLQLRVKRSVHPLAIVEHTYSHFKVVTHAYRCELSSAGIPGKNLKWVALKDLKKYPMGRIDRQLAGKSAA